MSAEHKVESEHHECTEDHDHEHAHGHDHENDMDGHDGKKSNKGEKKFKKAMGKMGMKPVTGITRVTFKKTKTILFYIDNPEVMKTPGVENSYIIFGEVKFQDFPTNLASDEAKKFKKDKAAEKTEGGEKVEVEDTKNEEGEIDLGDFVVDEEAVTMMIDQCNCTREAAIKALKKHNGDTVNALMELTN